MNPPGKPYHHGDLRKALIESGLKIIRKDGAHKISLRETARLAGVSEAAPYRHFDSKEALLAAIAEDGHLKLRARLTAAMELHPQDPIGQLQERAWAYTRFALDETDHFRVMFDSSFMPFDAERHPNLDRVVKESFAELTRIVQVGQDVGVLSLKRPARQAATHLWCSLHGFTNLLVDRCLDTLVNPHEARVFLSEHVDTLLHGLAP